MNYPAWLSRKQPRNVRSRQGGQARMASMTPMERREFQSAAARQSGLKQAAKRTPAERAAFARLGGLARWANRKDRAEGRA